MQTDRHDMARVPPISNKQQNTSEKNRGNIKLSKKNKIKFINSNVETKMRRRKYKFSKKARAAIYIGHIPHGFYEDQMREYFNQFGKVHSAVVIRSKKTGRSRGYGFVEFEDEDVAKIAAETMNNYLMFNRILKCTYISPEERKGPLYERPVYYVLPKVKNRILNSKNKNKAFKSLDQSAYLKKAQKKINDFKKFFEERGVDFSFKVNFPNLEDNKTDEPKTVEVESRNSCSSEEDVDEQFGVLEIDESDNDIHFKTPPQVKKIIKKSSTRTTALGKTPAKMRTQVEEQRMKLRNSSAREIRKHTTPERKKISNGIGRKLEKTTKVREKPLVKSLKSKKAENKKEKSLNKDGATRVTRKKGNDKEKKGSENKRNNC